MTGIVGYGTYVPSYRLDRAEMGAAVGASGRGARSVAGADEDTTTLGVAAAARALRAGASADGPLWFATGTPAYEAKTNASAIHAALSLPEHVGAYDLVGSPRSAVAALLAAAWSNGIAVVADISAGNVGSDDERHGGDGAAAFVFGERDPVAEIVGTGSASREFLDRWRLPGERSARVWEERFGEGAYRELAGQAVERAAKAAGVALGDVSAIAVAGANARAAASVGAALLRDAPGTHEAITAGELGNTGVAQPGMLLARALDAAGPDELVLLVVLADGADALLVRTTHRIGSNPGAQRAASDAVPISYPHYLLWRGLLQREPPRRPEPERPSAPFAHRDRAFKFGFQGGTCSSCGTTAFPMPLRCLSCGGGDFAPVAGAGQHGTVVTFTVDHLAYSANPPLISAVVDLDVGARLQLEVTDVRPDDLSVGARVELTFRRLFTAHGIHNYFWKARPLRGAPDGPR